MPSSADSAEPGRRLAGWAAGIGVALLFLALALYTGFPWLVAALAPRLAPLLGVEVLELDVNRPGLSTLRVEHLRVVSGRLDGRAEDVAVTFRPLALLRGRLQSVTVQRLTLRVAEAPASSAAFAVAGVPAPDTWLAALPVRQMSVAALQVAVPALGFHAGGGLELRGPALLAHLTGRAPAAAEGMTLAASLTRAGRVGVSLTAPDTDSAFVALTSAVEPGDAGDRLGLRGSVDLRGFPLALVRSLSGVPAGDGRVTGSFDVRLPWPLSDRVDWSSPAGSGELTVDWRPAAGQWRLGGLTMAWRFAAGSLAAELNGAVSMAGRPFAVRGRVHEWRLPAAGGTGELAVSLPVPNERPVLAAAWRVADALAVEGSVELGGSLFEQAADAAGLPAGGGRVDVQFDARAPWPLTTVSLAPAALGISATGTVGGNWQPTGEGPALPQLDGRWRLDGDVLSGSAQAEVGYRDLRAGLAVTLERLVVGAPALTAAGSVDLGGVGSVAFTVTPADRDATAVELNGRLDAGAGAGAGVLAGLITGWPGEFDATAGTVAVHADLAWPDGIPVGEARAEVQDVSAYYHDYRVSGLNTTLRFDGSTAGWHLPVTALHAARVDTGVELRDVDSGVGWRGDVVEVRATTLRLLGGRASIQPFGYRLDTGTADFLVTFDDLDLGRVLALQGELIQGSGTLDGGLPVRIDGGRPSISGGRVHADAPGGTLRVSESLAAGTSQPGLDFALRALQNFHYSVLTADVDYAADGDLTLAVHLQGRNPAIEQGRPIHYNVTVSQNLPVLLESLRLQEDVTRRIERRLNN